MTISGNPLFLLRRTKGNEENIGPASINAFNGPIILKAVNVVEEWKLLHPAYVQPRPMFEENLGTLMRGSIQTTKKENTVSLMCCKAGKSHHEIRPNNTVLDGVSGHLAPQQYSHS